jgi:hypothetical protein
MVMEELLGGCGAALGPWATGMGDGSGAFKNPKYEGSPMASARALKI